MLSSKLKYRIRVFVWLTGMFVFVLIAGEAQNRKQVTKVNGKYKEVCWVDKQNPSQRNGLSIKYYKGKVIEKGNYKENERVGRWRFYNLNSILDYEYDFDKKELVMMSGIDRHDLKRKSPCLFKGSPLVPYLYLVNNLGYPQKAISDDVEGKVVLALKINSSGNITGFYIAEKLHPVINEAVVKVAKTMPSDWEFIAATKFGKPVAGEYHIAIEFELEKR
jgi:TonB family protein